METKVGEEGGLTSGGVDVAVVGKFCNGEPGGPIVVLRGDKGSKNLLDGAVCDLRLAISLRVVGGGEVEGRSETFGREEGFPEVRSDEGVAVGNNYFGQAVFGEDVVDEDMGQLLGGEGFVGPNKMGLLGEHANEGEDGIIGVTVVGERGGQIGDAIHGDVGPWADRDVMGLEETRGSLCRGLDALTGGTGRDIGADSACHARPPEV